MVLNDHIDKAITTNVENEYEAIELIATIDDRPTVRLMSSYRPYGIGRGERLSIDMFHEKENAGVTTRKK